MDCFSTLRYANRAKNIKNKPKINEDPKDAMLREYQEEITKLKQLLDQKEPGEGKTICLHKVGTEKKVDWFVETQNMLLISGLPRPTIYQINGNFMRIPQNFTKLR